jgi:non-heme chloroperoxidase
LPHLPEWIHALVISQRGHGDSSRPEKSYRYQDFAADAAAFLDAAHIESAVIVGHSMGTTVAQRFALDYPARTLGLVLAASFANVGDNERVRELWGVVAEIEDPVPDEFVRGFQEGTTAQPLPQAFFETIVRESQKLPARVWKDAVACNMQHEFAGELNRIHAPTLLIWGDRDRVVPRSDQDAQVTAIADSRLVVYEGAGHGVHWEQPARFAHDLVQFIESNVARS